MHPKAHRRALKTARRRKRREKAYGHPTKKRAGSKRETYFGLKRAREAEDMVARDPLRPPEGLINARV